MPTLKILGGYLEVEGGGVAGGSPPGTWGGSGEPFPGYGLPPAGPGKPPGTWGGSGEPFPGYGLPGRPPGTWGGSGEPFPGYGLPPAGPPGTWGGSGEPFPGYGPPEGGPGGEAAAPKFEKKVAWSPQTGWIVIYIPTGTVPAPSGETTPPAT